MSPRLSQSAIMSAGSPGIDALERLRSGDVGPQRYVNGEAAVGHIGGPGLVLSTNAVLTTLASTHADVQVGVGGDRNADGGCDEPDRREREGILAGSDDGQHDGGRSDGLSGGSYGGLGRVSGWAVTNAVYGDYTDPERLGQRWWNGCKGRAAV